LLESLTRRLAECPADFLLEPQHRGRGLVSVQAVVRDLIDDLGAWHGLGPRVEGFEGGRRKGRNHLRLVLVASWLLKDPALALTREQAGAALEWLRNGLGELAASVDAELFVKEPDRREELVRLCLRALDLLPAGESQAQAADRLASLDSVEQGRVIRAAKRAQERAAAIREAMRKKAAAAAAAKVSRE
jgi:hypothetical protein